MFELEGMVVLEVGFIVMGSIWVIFLIFKWWLIVEIRLYGIGKDYKFILEFLIIN